MKSTKTVNLLINDFYLKFNIELKTNILTKSKTHTPSKLASNTKGVYVFMVNDTICFKVGKAGSKSKARWDSHHYNPKSSPSNLSNTILNNKEVVKEYFDKTKHNEIENLNENNISDWIKNNLTRVEFIIESDKEDFSLNLLEAFLLFKLKPIFEGNKA